MAADVHQHAAAANRRDYAPIGKIVPTRVEEPGAVDTREDDFTDGTLSNQRFHLHDVRIEIAIIGNHQGNARVPTRLHHALTFFNVHRHRFFAKDVLAGSRRADSLFAVQMRRRSDVNGVKFVIGEERVYVGVSPFRAVSGGERLGFPPVAPHHRDKFRIMNGIKRRTAFMLGDITAPDYAPSEVCHEKGLLLFVVNFELYEKN